MELILKIFLILNFLVSIESNYILIPFNTFIYNKKYDNTILQKDILSMRFLEDMYITLSLGNPVQTIKLLLRLDQNGLIINEPNYNYSLSNTFKLSNYLENKLICKDTFHFFMFNSSKELNDYIHKKNYNKKVEIVKYEDYKDIQFIYVNKTANYKFLEVDLKDEEIQKIQLLNYGMLGLRIRFYNTASSPDLIKYLKEIKAINSYIFSFYFNDKKNDTEHNGYLIIGDTFTDQEKEYDQINNTNFAMRYSRLSWDLRVETIYSESKIKTKKRNLYLEKNINVELNIEKSYILGSRNYKSFIEDIFFNELVKENVCQYKNLLVEQSYGTYVCNSKSKLFIEYYNNIFPDLVLKCYNLEDLILTKKDLFFYNEYNKSDTNIYFLIYFSTIYTTSWMMGRSFLEKYRFSFNHDTSFIMYHKRKFVDEKDENKIIKQNYIKNKIIKIIIIIILVLIIFLLGFLFHKLITKIPRKQKANELDDDFDYSISKDKNLYNYLDVNNNKFSNKNNLYLELGSKNI